MYRIFLLCTSIVSYLCYALSFYEHMKNYTPSLYLWSKFFFLITDGDTHRNRLGFIEIALILTLVFKL